jgi:uncharacterized protein (DUF697 family)
VKALPVKPLALWGVVKEVKAAVEDFRPLVVAGAPGRAAELVAALVERGKTDAVRDRSGRTLTSGDVEDAAVLVYLIEGESASEADEHSLRLAGRRGVGIVCVLERPGGDGLDPVDVPYVQATDLLVLRPGEPLPVARIVERAAARADEYAYALAARLPALREAVCEGIVERFARQNAVIGAAVFIPGADLPALTLNQARMVFRIAAAYGETLEYERAAELLAVVGAGLGLRAVARQLLGVVPIAGWAVKGAVAYAGTKALGRAAITYFEAGGSSRVVDVVRSRS